MNYKVFFSPFVFMSIFLLGCEKKIEPEISLLGEWISEYEIMEDGTKNFDDPYAILVFEYSNGFILEENGQGSSIWNGAINGAFEWTKMDNKILMFVPGPNNSTSTFEFQISNVTNESMDFYSPKEHRYFLTRK